MDKDSQPRPDGKSLGLPAYLVWLGNQITATAVGSYATLGVGFLEARILFALGRHPESPAANLVRHLGVDRAAISRALWQLRSAGMISVDEHRRYALTDAGRTKRAEVVHISDQRLDGLTANFTEAELDQLLALLQRLHRNVPDLVALNMRLMAGSGRGRRPGRAALRRSQDHRATLKEAGDL